MAIKGAHISSSIQEKPSLFEVLACDSLDATLYPAINKIFSFIALKQSRNYEWFFKHAKECYFLFNGIIQTYYIKNYNSSLSETFYGLKRFSKNNTELSKTQKYLSIFSVAIAPYILSKIDDILEKWKDDIQINSNIKHNNIKKKLIFIHRQLKIIYNVWKTFHLVSYLINKSTTHSPFMQITNMHLNYTEREKFDWTWKNLFSGNINFSKFFLSTVLFNSLELFGFFLQFMQWWYNEGDHKQLNFPIPEPPELDENSEKYANICPICLLHWELPTAITISGYVCCYKCIVNHIENTKACPVTSYPITIDDLVRIYDV